MLLFIKSTLHVIVLFKLLTGVTSAAFDDYGTIDIDFTGPNANIDLPSIFNSWGLNNLGNILNTLYTNNNPPYGSKPFIDFGTGSYFKPASVYGLINHLPYLNSKIDLKNLGYFLGNNFIRNKLGSLMGDTYLNHNNLGFGTATPTSLTQLVGNLGTPKLDNLFSLNDLNRIFSSNFKNDLSKFYNNPYFNNGYNSGFGTATPTSLTQLLKLAKLTQGTNFGNNLGLDQNYPDLDLKTLFNTYLNKDLSHFDPSNIFGTSLSWNNPTGTVQIPPFNGQPTNFDISKWLTANLVPPNFDFTKIFTPENISPNGVDFPEISVTIENILDQIPQDPDNIKNFPEIRINPAGNKLPLAIEEFIDYVAEELDPAKAVNGNLTTNLDLPKIESALDDILHLQESGMNPQNADKIINNLFEVLKNALTPDVNVDITRSNYMNILDAIKKIKNWKSPVNGIVEALQDILNAAKDGKFPQFNPKELQKLLDKFKNTPQDAFGLPDLRSAVKTLLKAIPTLNQDNDGVLKTNLNLPKLQSVLDEIKNIIEQGNSSPIQLGAVLPELIDVVEGTVTPASGETPVNINSPEYQKVVDDIGNIITKLDNLPTVKVPDILTELPTLSVDSPKFKNILKEVPEIGLEYPGIDTLKDVPYVDLIHSLTDVLLKAVDNVQGGKIYINPKLLEKLAQDLKNLEENKLNPEGSAGVVQNLVDLIEEVKNPLKNDKDGVTEVDTNQKQFQDAIKEIGTIGDNLRTATDGVDTLPNQPDVTENIQSILKFAEDGTNKLEQFGVNPKDLANAMEDAKSILDKDGVSFQDGNVVHELVDVIGTILDAKNAVDGKLNVSIDLPKIEAALQLVSNLPNLQGVKDLPRKTLEDLIDVINTAVLSMKGSIKGSPQIEVNDRQYQKVVAAINALKGSRNHLTIDADSNVDNSHVDGSHVDDSHVDDSHVDDSHVDDSHVDDSHVDNSHVDDSHVDIPAFTDDVQSILDATNDPDFKFPKVNFDRAKLKSVMTDTLAVINAGKNSQGIDLPKLANVVRGLFGVFVGLLNCKRGSGGDLNLSLDLSELQNTFQDLSEGFKNVKSAQDNQFENSSLVELMWKLVRILKGVLIPEQGAAKTGISKAILQGVCLGLKSAQTAINGLNLVAGLPLAVGGGLVKGASDLIKTSAGVMSNFFNK